MSHTPPTDAQKRAWQANRPRKSIAVKAIMYSDRGNILLLQPHHRDVWQLPGGAVEAGEDPTMALLRELQEELSLQVSSDQITLMDAVFRDDYDVLILMYACTMTVSEDVPINFQQSEIMQYTFVPPSHVSGRISSYYDAFLRKHIAK